MKESIQEAASDAVTPSQFLSRLAGIVAAHGQDAKALLDLAAKAACAEQDARTLDGLMGVGDPVEHPGKYWDEERRADELYFGEGREQEEDKDDEKD